jgi:hypothetical protein
MHVWPARTIRQELNYVDDAVRCCHTATASTAPQLRSSLLASSGRQKLDADPPDDLFSTGAYTSSSELVKSDDVTLEDGETLANIARDCS